MKHLSIFKRLTSHVTSGGTRLVDKTAELEKRLRDQMRPLGKRLAGMGAALSEQLGTTVFRMADENMAGVEA
ncbi:MAG TPA: hypothetical protein VE422_45715 [Terriglobia bacterium]|nr:hypothetical protein [Terriglobia bacterium]